MSYSNGIISAPVSIDDVKSALGESSNNLGTLCKSDNINIWSKYKPVKYATSVPITKTQLMNCKYGLSPSENNNLLKCTYGYTNASNNFANTSFDKIKNSNSSWSYIKPVGGSSSPYRLSDFCNPENPTQNGYNNNTPPPLSGFSDWDIKASELRTAYNAIISTKAGSDGSSNAYNHTIVDSKSNPYTQCIYSNFNFKFGESSYQTVGNMSSDVIPINFVLGSNINNEYWRIGIAIKAPNRNIVDIIVSNYTLYEYNAKFKDNPSAASAALLMPGFETNQVLAYWLERAAFNNVTSIENPYIIVPAFPCLVENAMFGGESRITGGSNPWIYPKFTTEGSCYSTPLLESFNITILSNIKYSDSEIESYNLFSIRSVFTGSYVNLGSGESWNNYPINQIMIFRKNAVGSYKITYTIDYGYMVKKSDGTISNTRASKSSEITMVSGNTSAILISGKPSLGIINKTYKCTKV